MKSVRMSLFIILILCLLTGCGNNMSKTFNLNYTQVEKKSEITKISEVDIDNIIRKLELNDALVFLYRPQTDPEQINGGVKIKGNFYDVGLVSVYQEGNEIQLKNLFGKKLVKLCGALGANYSQAIYLSIEDSNPNVILQVDGHVMEKDIDNDTEDEIISSWGTPTNTKIYKNIGDAIMVSDLNQSTNAQVVLYRDELNLFEIYAKPNEPRFYKLLDKVLTEIKNP